MGTLFAHSWVCMNTARSISALFVASLFVSANAYAQEETNTPATPAADEKEEKKAQLPAPPPPPPAMPIAPQIKPLPIAQPRVITPASIWWGKDFEIPQKPREHWYGWQTLIVLAAADLTAIASYQNLNAGVSARWGLTLGISAHALGGPIVHWAHGHVGRGFAAFGLNTGFLALGIISGITLMDPTDYLLPMSIVGGIVGPILDVAFLSTETIREPFLPSAGRSGRSITNFGVVPLVNANQRGLLFVGQF